MDIDSEDGFINISKRFLVSDKIKGRYVQEGNEKIWSLYIKIDELSTIAEIKGNWYKIEKLRNDIIQEKGVNFNIFKNSLVHYLIQLNHTIYIIKSNPTNYSDLLMDNSIFNTSHQKHESFLYKDLAAVMNFDSLLFFLCVFNEKISSNERKIFETYLDNLFKTFSIKDEERIKLKNLAQKHINNDELPWGLNTGPITNEKVRSKIRKIKDIVKMYENTGLNYLMNTWKWTISKSFWLSLLGQLNRFYPDDYLQYQQIISQRSIDIIGYLPKLRY